MAKIKITLDGSRTICVDKEPSGFPRGPLSVAADVFYDPRYDDVMSITFDHCGSQHYTRDSFEFAATTEIAAG